MPTRPRKVDSAAIIFTNTAAIRKMRIVNFATKAARMNAIMTAAGGNTFVESLAYFRAKSLEGEFIYDVVRSPGEPLAETAMEKIKFLCDGSPMLRCVFQVMLERKILEPLNKEGLKSHQKMVFAELVPFNAFFLVSILRMAMIDARVMHAGINNEGKSKLVKKFNDPDDPFKVFTILGEVGSAGLNLHEANNLTLFGTYPINKAQEVQTSGRSLRVRLLLPAKPFVNHTNKHCV